MNFKRIILTIPVAILSVFAMAQAVPNGNFEFWNNIPLFEEPEGYSTTNGQSFVEVQKLSVTKSTDAAEGKYSMKIMSFSSATDTFSGVAAYSTDIRELMDGFPFAGKPDSFKLKAKFHCAQYDKARIAVLFMNSGWPLGIEVYSLEGDQSSWKEFAFPIEPLKFSPDTAYFIFASGNPDGDTLSPDNWLMVDDVSFTGTTATAPNNGFENWVSFGSEEPFGWNTFNTIFQILGMQPYALKSSDAQDGSFAMAITTVEAELDSQKRAFGVITTGILRGNYFGGGFKLDNKPDSVSFYYKYDNSNNTDDTAIFYMGFSKFNSATQSSDILDSNVVFLTASSTYQYKSIAFDLSSFDIDTANIMLASGNFFNETNIGIGNRLLIDNILLYFKGVGIPLDKLTGSRIMVFPNPASDVLNIDLKGNDLSGTTLTITGLGGKTYLRQENITHDGIISQDISVLKNGIYFYRLTNEQTIVGEGKFQVSK